MSVGNTGENKLQRCNWLLELRSGILFYRVVKESLVEQNPKGGEEQPRLVWLSGLSADLRTKGSLV